MVVPGLLLAAGAGRRMGQPKALVRADDGTAWVTRSADVLAQGGCDPVLVVVGARAADVAALVPERVRVVTAADWAEGMGASLRAGLRALGATATDDGSDAVAAVVGLVDTPGVTPEVIRRLVAQARSAGPGGLARAAYAGVPGHPVVLGRAHWAAVAAAVRGDEGARGYLAGRDVVQVECGDAGDGTDHDTPASA
jgi:nicotine blue oxidoreductase